MHAMVLDCDDEVAGLPLRNRHRPYSTQQCTRLRAGPARRQGAAQTRRQRGAVRIDFYDFESHFLPAREIQLGASDGHTVPGLGIGCLRQAASRSDLNEQHRPKRG